MAVAGEQPAAQWPGMDEVRRHREAGPSVWRWASTDDGENPEVVLAQAGGIPTVETPAAADLLRRDLPGARIRFVNPLDLCAPAPPEPERRPHGLDEADRPTCSGRTLPSRWTSTATRRLDEAVPLPVAPR
ncbi:hypothetical protein ACIOKD_18785 [Streptomyces sp. NPDC087844]|uniref:phosphoketolase family protein n=1 Tax=Streptomyces sp. NPDC087844 TaxID=3365805 RepID=UPI0037FBB0F4